MKFKEVTQKVTNRVGRQILQGRKHAPFVLFTVGVVGVIGTVVLASRATLKLDEVLDETNRDLDRIRNAEREDYTDQDRLRDKATVYATAAGRLVRLYGPAAGVAVVSISALTGSHVILTRRNSALAAAYAVLDRGWREYRSRVVNEFGADKDRELRYNLQERTIIEETEEGPITTKVKDVVPAVASIYARFFDKSSPNWNPRNNYNQVFIQCQQNWLNNLLQARGHVFLNEAYDALGIPRSKEGQIVGWLKEGGDDFVDFGVFEGDINEGVRFVMGHNDTVLLDFNVDGVIYDKI